jgi:hypothetical protein
VHAIINISVSYYQKRLTGQTVVHKYRENPGRVSVTCTTHYDWPARTDNGIPVVCVLLCFVITLARATVVFYYSS